MGIYRQDPQPQVGIKNATLPAAVFDNPPFNGDKALDAALMAVLIAAWPADNSQQPQAQVIQQQRNVAALVPAPVVPAQPYVSYPIGSVLAWQPPPPTPTLDRPKVAPWAIITYGNQPPNKGALDDVSTVVIRLSWEPPAPQPTLDRPKPASWAAIKYGSQPVPQGPLSTQEIAELRRAWEPPDPLPTLDRPKPAPWASLVYGDQPPPNLLEAPDTSKWRVDPQPTQIYSKFTPSAVFVPFVLPYTQYPIQNVLAWQPPAPLPTLDRPKAAPWASLIYGDQPAPRVVIDTVTRAWQPEWRMPPQLTKLPQGFFVPPADQFPHVPYPIGAVTRWWPDNSLPPQLTYTKVAHYASIVYGDQPPRRLWSTPKTVEINWIPPFRMPDRRPPIPRVPPPVVNVPPPHVPYPIVTVWEQWKLIEKLGVPSPRRPTKLTPPTGPSPINRITGIREYYDDWNTATANEDCASITRRPDAVSMDYLTAYTVGPVNIADVSLGVLNRAWRMEARVAGEVTIARSNDTQDGWEADSVLFTYTGAPILELDCAFDQAGRAFVTAERATGPGGTSEVWVYWFKPAIHDFIFEKISTGFSPRCLLDNPDDTANSDILVFYVHNDTLMYRQQRDAYLIEITTPITSAPNIYVEEVFRTTGHRLMVVMSHRNLTTGRYELKFLESTLYPIFVGPDDGQANTNVRGGSYLVAQLNTLDLTEMQANAFITDATFGNIIQNILHDIDEAKANVVPSSTSSFFNIAILPNDLVDEAKANAAPNSGSFNIAILITLFDLDEMKANCVIQSGALA